MFNTRESNTNFPADVMIYMAISLDGFIAGSNNETPWSEAEWENYKKYITEYDCLIIGKTTYEMMLKADEFQRIGNPNVLVISKKTFISSEKIKSFSSPEEAVSFCNDNTWKKIIIGGGQQINSYFLNNKIANKLHIDLEPIIMGAGLKIFDNIPEYVSLELSDIEKLESGTVSCNYLINYQ